MPCARLKCPPDSGSAPIALSLTTRPIPAARAARRASSSMSAWVGETGTNRNRREPPANARSRLSGCVSSPATTSTRSPATPAALDGSRTTARTRSPMPMSARTTSRPFVPVAPRMMFLRHLLPPNDPAQQRRPRCEPRCPEERPSRPPSAAAAWSAVSQSDLLLALEGHLQERVPSLAVRAGLADLMPPLLIELDREADGHSAVLALEAPLDAPVPDLRVDIDRLSAEVMRPPAVALRPVVVGNHRQRLMHHDCFPRVGLPGAPALDEQDRAADLPLDRFGDREVVTLVALCGGPAGPLPLPDPKVQLLHRFDLGRRRDRGLGANRRPCLDGQGAQHQQNDERATHGHSSDGCRQGHTYGRRTTSSAAGADWLPGATARRPRSGAARG